MDFGGTKIEVAAVDQSGDFVARERVPNPGAYEPAIRAVADLVLALEARTGADSGRGLGVSCPGSLSPQTRRIRNSNSTFLNGRAFGEDLSAALNRPVRLANDADCLALSEWADGAAVGAPVVFAAILGTGCGGGVVANGALITGRNGVAGEWGHSPLPSPTPEEAARGDCWCGRRGCLETWISGSGFRADHRRVTGRDLTGQEIVAAARQGDADAAAALDRYVDRLARGLAWVVNLLDPDVIVLGGGMSNVTELYDRLPEAIAPHVFSDVFTTPVVQARHGDSSGVRGAARLFG